MTRSTTKTAFDAAREAHEYHFQWHRGAFSGDDPVILYDNHPWRGRALEHAMLRRWLTDHGCRWAEGHYPTSGEDRGYTVAFVIDVDDDEPDSILDAWQQAISVTHAMAADGTLDQMATIALQGGSS